MNRAVETLKNEERELIEALQEIRQNIRAFRDAGELALVEDQAVFLEVLHDELAEVTAAIDELALSV